MEDIILDLISDIVGEQVNIQDTLAYHSVTDADKFDIALECETIFDIFIDEDVAESWETVFDVIDSVKFRTK